MSFAVQVLAVSRPYCRRRWQTITIEKRLSAARNVLASIRQERAEVVAISRIKHVPKAEA